MARRGELGMRGPRRARFFSRECNAMNATAPRQNADAGTLPARFRPAGPAPRGFTLIEAMVAIALTAIAGSALLLGTSASLQTTEDAMRQTIARGIAEQLMDEVVGSRYTALGGSSSAGSAGLITAGSRTAFDAIDDFNGYRKQPPTDPFGVALGTDDGRGGRRNPLFQCRAGFLDDWREEIDVFHVSEGDLLSRLPAGQTSDYKAVEVRIVQRDPSRGDRELAKIRRVVAYVAPLQVQ